MKKYLFPVLLGTLMACAGNDTDTGNAAAQLKAAAVTTEKTADAVEPPAGSCGNLLFFKKGIEIEATTFQADGTVTRKDKTIITNVHSDAGVTIAEAESAEITEGKTGGKTTHYTYKCDGKSFYVDISQLMGSLDTKGAKLSVSELTFPINIKEDEKLPDATFTMDMTYGNKTMQTKVTYKDRKVEGKETLTIKGGSWNCYKVSALLETEMMGFDEKTTKLMESMKAKQPKMKSVMWYAPDAGVLRFDLYMGDALKSYSQVTAIKE